MVRLHLFPFLSDLTLGEIDVGAVDALESDLITTNRLSRRTVDMALGTLRLILSHAQVRGFVASNAVDTWKATVAGRGRRRNSSPSRRVDLEKVLEEEEREALLEAFEAKEPHYFPLVLFLAETGTRISEPLGLTWSQVDIPQREAQIFRPKTGSLDHIELSDRLAEVLGQIEPDLRPDDLLVFQTPGGSPIRYENFRRRVWSPVIWDLFAGRRRITPHMLRHTWVSLYLGRGTPIEWIRKMGGWASTQMLLDTYAHFLPRDMRGFSNALGSGDGPRRTQRPGRRGAQIAEAP